MELDVGLQAFVERGVLDRGHRRQRPVQRREGALLRRPRQIRDGARGEGRELAPHGITCNAVSPGAADTDIRAGATDAEREAALSASIPLGRQATPEDIAALFVFLSSEDAAYLTGTTQNINGGSYTA